MSTLTPSPRPVKASVTLTDRPQLVCARAAARFVRAAKFVAVYVVSSAGGAGDILDVSKRRLLRLLRRRDRVWLSEAFGTVVLGTPGEPKPA